MKEATITRSGDVLQVRLTCEIDHHTAKTIREEVDRELRSLKPRLLSMDFSEVRFMDSSGIGLILGRVNTAEEIGAKIEIRSLSEPLQKLVRMSGIEKLKSITVVKGV